MEFPEHKTKIVCTIGPASSTEEVLERLLKTGMNVARLNFAHGTLESHREVIKRIRKVSSKLNLPCMILGDLPGPKIRIGKLQKEPLYLTKGESIILTTKESTYSEKKIHVNYDKLPESVSVGSVIYINDGFIQLQVEEVLDYEIRCTVLIGGELLSGKGLNLPGAKLYVEPVTAKDFEFIEFSLNEGIDAIGVSFVERAEDIRKVKKFAEAKGSFVYVVAKIERAEALENIDEIVEAADAIMIARGDLGVQIPLEDVPSVQKKLIHKANLMAKPVIIATQMLISMTQNIRPTRAEVSDVANAILDGADALMLSEETAIGRYPVESTAMLVRIASSTERQRKEINSLTDLSNISKFKPDCWILVICSNEKVRNFLTLSYGVIPLLLENKDEVIDDATVRAIVDEIGGQKDTKVVLTEITSPEHPNFIDSLKIITLKYTEQKTKE
uniref:Pyruvate kinase n=1 Tax=Thermodesulfobacterium geofontis TaxID=1295609 RepID=A0A7V5XHD2_9BACT